MGKATGQKSRFGIAASLTIVAGIIVAGPARADDTGLTFRGWLSWLSVAETTTPDQKSAVNPNNELLKLPSESFISELRPNLKLTAANVQFVVRPRVEYTYDLIKVDGKALDGQSKTQSYVNDAFMQWTISDSTTFSYGLQSYQWGSAETLSPSNRIFHDTAAQRDVLYEVRGKNIARINFSSGKNFSTVVMADVKENKDEPVFIADTPWTPSVLIKSEYSWHEGADYAGLVAGGHGNGHPWIGEYFSYGLPFFDGLSLFADASHQRGTDAWYPTSSQQATPFGPQNQIVFAQTRQTSMKAYTLAAGGLKYDFINGTILRGEYVYNEAGYTVAERKLANNAIGSKAPLQRAVLAQNLPRFEENGLDLPGQRYAYASLHIPDFILTDMNWDARSFYSIMDHTSLSYISIDYKLTDSGTLTAAVGGSTGPRDGELKGYTAPVEYLAYRHDW